MKIKTSYCLKGLACIFGLILWSSTQTACSSSDDDETGNTEQRNDGRQLRRLVFSDVSITRATLEEKAKTLSGKWTAGDQATYFNLSSYTPSNIDFGNLTASSSEATSAFTGSVICDKDDIIALWYPAKSPTTTGSDRGKFSIDLSGQKGTLSDIATKYHFVYGIGQVTSVNEETANATISSMKSLLAVWKLSFIDKEIEAIIPVKTLSINYYDAGGYPLTGKITPSGNIESVTIDVNMSFENPLTIDFGEETSNEVYVALFPCGTKEEKEKLHFTVTNDAGTYTGTANVALAAGKFYTTSLKLTKQ